MTFDMNRAWRGAMDMFSANREVLLIVAGIFFFLPQLLASIVLPDMSGAMANPEDSQAMIAMLTQIYTNYWWLFLIVVLAQGIGFLGMIALLRDSSKPTVGEALMAGLKALLPYILASIIMSVIFMMVFVLIVGVLSITGIPALAALGMAIALAAFFYLGVRFSLLTAVMAIENILNPVGALRRSWTLTKGHSVRLLLFYALILVAYLVISLVIGLVMGGLVLALGGSTIGLFLNAVVSGLIGAAATSLFATLLASIHHQLSGPSTQAIGSTFD
ncbi:hypothetical protein [Altericroceibacterium endophyticum]|uniref:Glycerophosphoryl diester phosphodiesterase membrane domain-containing protein n=1 Tax=Altericroceibacterium endophyticum TaxID=1808508 RepID=A0A6I4T9T6_9SPHN|nr:hypothetical protein [Altericroceibacterium endophyticum]MXO66630.1 hypothetical protein [Altericroceibacterium endophyticum]